MKLKYYIPFLICLISLSGFGQNTLKNGLSKGYDNQLHLEPKIDSELFYLAVEECNRNFISPDDFFKDPNMILRNSYLKFKLTSWNLMNNNKQDQEAVQSKRRNLNAVYLELNTFYFFSILDVTVNYDRVLFSAENEKVTWRLTGRAGIGTFIEDSRDLLWTIGISGLVGDNGNYFEIGTGLLSDAAYINVNYRHQKNWLFVKAGFRSLIIPDFVYPLPVLGVGVAF